MAYHSEPLSPPPNYREALEDRLVVPVESVTLGSVVLNLIVNESEDRVSNTTSLDVDWIGLQL